MIYVVAGMIKRENKILIGKRLYGEPAGLWEFPGGKIEINETPENAIKRELKEELNIEVSNIKYTEKNTYDYPTRTINIQLFSCDYISGNLKLDSHSEVLWIDIDDIFNYKFAPADIKLAEYIYNHKKELIK